jgi:hypothetical protein
MQPAALKRKPPAPQTKIPPRTGRGASAGNGPRRRSRLTGTGTVEATFLMKAGGKWVKLSVIPAAVGGNPINSFFPVDSGTQPTGMTEIESSIFVRLVVYFSIKPHYPVMNCSVILLRFLLLWHNAQDRSVCEHSV